MPAPQRPHRQAGPPVVRRAPGRLTPARGRPQRAQRRVVLHHERPTGQWCPGGQRTVGQIQVQGAYDVQARAVGEEPELRARTGIEAQLAGEPLGQCLDLRVGRPQADRRQARPARPGPLLAAGAVRAYCPGPVGVAVEEPVAVRSRRQELLQQQPAARLPGPQEQLPRLPRRAHHDGAAQPGPGRHQPGPAPLGDHRQPGPPDGGGLLGAVRDGGLRVRDPGRRAHLGQLGLVGDPLGKQGGLPRQQTGGSQVLAEPACRDRARVVHRDQHRRTGDPRRHPAQHGRDRGSGRARRRWRMQLPYEPDLPTGLPVESATRCTSTPALPSERTAPRVPW